MDVDLFSSKLYLVRRNREVAFGHQGRSRPSDSFTIREAMPYFLVFSGLGSAFTAYSTTTTSLMIAISSGLLVFIASECEGFPEGVTSVASAKNGKAS